MDNVRIDEKKKKNIQRVGLELLGRPKILNDCLIKLVFAVPWVSRFITFCITVVL